MIVRLFWINCTVSYPTSQSFVSALGSGARSGSMLYPMSDGKRYGIPQAHPELLFMDYTKQAARLGKTPENYRLILVIAGGLSTATKTGGHSKLMPPWR